MLSILLVDDEPGILEALTSYLRLRGFEVVPARSCADAMASIAACSLDCVVTDQRLPDGFGRDIVERFREANPSRSALVCTADPDGELQRWADRSEVDLVCKPLRPAALLQWLEANATPTPDCATAATARLEITGLEPDELLLCERALQHFAECGDHLETRHLGARVQLIFAIEDPQRTPSVGSHFDSREIDAWIAHDRFGQPERLVVQVELSGTKAPDAVRPERVQLWQGTV